MAGEGDFLHTAFAVVIAIDVDPAGGAALSYPGGDVQRMAGAAAGLKVDRRPGELYIAALGAELNAFDDPTDREFPASGRWFHCAAWLPHRGFYGHWRPPR